MRVLLEVVLKLVILISFLCSWHLAVGRNPNFYFFRVVRVFVSLTLYTHIIQNDLSQMTV